MLLDQIDQILLHLSNCKVSHEVVDSTSTSSNEPIAPRFTRGGQSALRKTV